MSRPLAIVTGASSGTGLELAMICAREGFDLVLAADRPNLETAADRLRDLGATVTAVRTDLATTEGVDELWAAVAGRPVDALLAHAGHGLGHAFLDQDFAAARHVVDTNVTGTIYLIQLVCRTMRSRGKGRILSTGSIAGFIGSRTDHVSPPASASRTVTHDIAPCATRWAAGEHDSARGRSHT